jgi:hypothetical protein
LIEKLWGAKPYIYTAGIQATHVQRTTRNAVPTNFRSLIYPRDNVKNFSNSGELLSIVYIFKLSTKWHQNHRTQTHCQQSILSSFMNMRTHRNHLLNVPRLKSDPAQHQFGTILLISILYTPTLLENHYGDVNTVVSSTKSRQGRR